MDAGADSAITQYFYNLDAYLHFRDDAGRWASPSPSCRASCPSCPFSKLARFSDACGAEIPRWMRRKFEAYGDDTTPSRPSARRGERAVRQAAGRRRAGAALLQHEPGGPHHRPVRTPGARRLTAMRDPLRVLGVAPTAADETVRRPTARPPASTAPDRTPTVGRRALPRHPGRPTSCWPTGRRRDYPAAPAQPDRRPPQRGQLLGLLH